MGAGLRARSVARLAARRDIDLNFARHARKGILELDLHVIAEVGAARGAALLASAAERRAEDRFENIADVAEIGTIAAAETAVAIDAGLAETIIGGALLRVFQAVIGFADRLEARFAVVAPRILVGVIFHRELAVARLQRGIVGGALDFQQFVIIDVE